MQQSKRILIQSALLATALAASGAVLAADPAKQQIVIGTTVGDFGDQVRQSIRPLLEKQGYKVKLVEFTDYVRPNLALQEGSLDLNVFQHRP
ncbi:MAG: MetQ/NlpA family ABC transporter substrate-binding protein, partial [Brachymonas denitrificans]